MSLPNVHGLYHVWFKWLDPLSLAPTVYALIFHPDFMVEALVPATLSPYNPDQAFLIHQLAALYAFVGITLWGVLRLSHDINVWRVIIAGVLLIDITILASLYVSLEQQNRLSLEAMRGTDWGNVLYTGLVAVIRASFLAGIGVRDQNKSKNA